MKYISYYAIIFCLCVGCLISCSTRDVSDLKSPCVSADIDGTINPCGPRRAPELNWQIS